MTGYGYSNGPLQDETSSSEHHYELMALARVLAEGVGLTADGQDRPAFLSDIFESLESSRSETGQLLAALVSALGEIRDRIPSTTGGGGTIPEGLDTKLEAIREELSQMRAIMQAGHDAGEAIRQEAQDVLEAHAQAAQNYMQQLPTEPEPDYHPFESLPAGTTVRDLADGGRLFGLPNADQIRVNPDGSMAFIGADGQAQPVGPPQGRQVSLPNGMSFTLRVEAVRVTHEAAMIEGLPWDIEPARVAEARYSVALPGNIRLDVNHAERSATVINPAGTVVYLSLPRVEGIGEAVEVRLVAGGAKGFAAVESGHRGIIESGGTIHLGLSNGLDLVIRFPETSVPDTGSGCGGVCGIQCEERAQ